MKKPQIESAVGDLRAVENHVTSLQGVGNTDPKLQPILDWVRSALAKLEGEEVSDDGESEKGKRQKKDAAKKVK